MNIKTRGGQTNYKQGKLMLVCNGVPKKLPPRYAAGVIYEMFVMSPP